MQISKLVMICIVLALAPCLKAQAEDGTYDAEVTTSSSTYTVPVEVKDGEVTQVHWSNGGDMDVSGAELDGITASGTNSRDDTVDVEIEDPSYDETSE